MDLFHRIGRKAHANGVADAGPQQIAQTNGALHRAKPGRASFGDAQVERIVAGFCETGIGRNGQEDVAGLSFINGLRPVTYNMDVDAIEAFHGRTLPPDLREAADAKEKIRYTGFIAQEVEQAAKNAGYDFSGVDIPKNPNESYGVRYGEFVVPLVKATQELNEKVEALETIVKEQDAIISKKDQELKEYEAMVSILKQRLDALEAEARQNSAHLQVVNR